jgi:glutathione peroxidase
MQNASRSCCVIILDDRLADSFNHKSRLRLGPLPREQRLDCRSSQGEIAMRRFVHLTLAALISFAFVLPARADEKGDKKVPPVLNFKMKSLAGQEVDLSQYQGKVVLIVNVASKCGFTPQYKGLEALHEKYASQGLVVLGVPSNDFGGQEPGSSEQIAQFCEKNFGVKFDMLEKVPVKGDAQVPLYKYLTSKETNPSFAGPIKWNFTKFLIGRNGEIAARFESKVKPEDEKVIKAIETELAK